MYACIHVCTYVLIFMKKVLRVVHAGFNAFASGGNRIFNFHSPLQESHDIVRKIKTDNNKIEFG